MTEQFIVGDDVLDVPRSCSRFYEAEKKRGFPFLENLFVDAFSYQSISLRRRRARA